MKACKIAAAVSLAWLGLASVGAQPAEAFGWYHSNDPVRVDHCYRGPAWDYMAPYYTSRRFRGGGCDKHCCIYSHKPHAWRARTKPLK